MGLKFSMMVPIGTEVRIMDWEVTVNISKSTLKWMMEYLERAAYSVTKFKPEPKEKISFTNTFVNCKKINKKDLLREPNRTNF